MANPTTAEEWKQVAANASAQIAELRAQAAAATANEAAAVAAAQAEYNRLRAFANDPKNFDLKTPEGIAAFKAAKAEAVSYKDNQLNSALEAQSNAEQQYTSQINQLRQTQSNAERQASSASSGTPNTSTNTAPVNPEPGNNTTVTTTPPPAIENSIATSVDDGSDPYVSNGNTTVPTSSPQVPVDDGSDPYVSNGNTTIETVENETPATIGAEDPFEASRQAAEDEYNNTPPRTEQDVIGAYGGMQGLQGSVNDTRAKQITQDAENAKTKGDWRVRLSLAPSAGYLYKAENPGILGYLQATDGVVFPYTPQISVNYAAHYESSDLVHSNYKLFQYKNSSVDQVTISCDFTAQDTFEANYLLAVIHFFRSVTKMFYGKDQQPGPGVPPPLCYLSGLGEFQFDKHPLVITNFNYSLPNDVDYIRAGSPTLEPGVDASMYQYQEDPGLVDNGVSCRRLGANGLVAGAEKAAPKFSKATNTQPTYVPTKIQLSITAYPIATRNDISNNFSLKEYATGKLLQGSKNPGGGGIW